jgi:D-glycero-D-manno-heptose 1,7-bisphosphate phosphatase
VFLDRDGTINVEKGYAYRIQDFDFVSGAIEALRVLSRARIDIIVVTNQSGIARGIFSEADLDAFNQHMEAELLREGVKLAGIYFCPHHPDARVPAYRKICSCRKPSPGLLITAMFERGIGPGEAVMIGDKNSDIEAGRAAGLTTYLVQTGYGAGERGSTNATHVVPDLLRAVRHIVGEWASGFYSLLVIVPRSMSFQSPLIGESDGAWLLTHCGGQLQRTTHLLGKVCKVGAAIFMMVVVSAVGGYLSLNWKRNSDPLNRKCAAEICECLTSSPGMVSFDEIHEIFRRNARYKLHANHVLSMVPGLLMKGGYPKREAINVVSLLRVVVASIPRRKLPEAARWNVRSRCLFVVVDRW